MIRTRLTEMFGLDYPLMSAPMALHSGGTLAAAVSKAGALGSFGGIHPAKGPDWLREEIRYIRSHTDKPFGVGYINAFVPMFQQHLEAALEERTPIVALSFGSPQPWLDKAKAAGAKVICQVQAIEHAREAAAGGADVLVAQGNEAGGHTGTMNLLPFLARVVEAFPDVPVLAAGGIGSGRALAAALAAGADGAWVGTALLATPEAVEVSDAYKQLIVESDGQDTIFTSVYDIMWGMPWPEGIGERVRRNRFTDQWHGREDDLRQKREELIPSVMAARERSDREAGEVLYGQSAAFVNAVRPAAEVVRSICDEAERILRERPRGLLE